METFGIHAMLSSNSLNEEYYPTLARTLFELVLEIKSKLNIQISFVDFAGGIGIPYRNEDNAVDIIRIGDEVRKIYNELLTPAGIDVAIYTELARFITGPHGYLITKVIGEKHTYREYVGVNATACCLMRPAIYGAYHHIFVMGKEDEKAEQRVDVVGSLCENNDKFAINRELPKIEVGDVLAICDAGAHCHSMGYNYNGKLRPAEYGESINNTQNAGEGGYQNMIAFTAVPFPQQQSNEQVGRSGKYSPIVFETWLTHSKLNVNVAAKGDANGYVVEYYIPFSTMSALTTSKGGSESYSFSGMDNFANGKELYFSILLSDGVDWTTLIVTDSSTFDASAMDGFSLEDESQDKTPAEVKQTLNSFTKEVNKLHFVQSVDCTVSFETFDGGTISSFVVDSGTSVDLTKYTASKKGYTFIGWCNDINCQNLVSEPVVSANTTFYAKYEKDKVVSFATGNGSKVDSVTVPHIRWRKCRLI